MPPGGSTRQPWLAQPRPALTTAAGARAADDALGADDGAAAEARKCLRHHRCAARTLPCALERACALTYVPASFRWRGAVSPERLLIGNPPGIEELL